MQDSRPRTPGRERGSCPGLQDLGWERGDCPSCVECRALLTPGVHPSHGGQADDTSGPAGRAWGELACGGPFNRATRPRLTFKNSECVCLGSLGVLALVCVSVCLGSPGVLAPVWVSVCLGSPGCCTCPFRVALAGG